jgi:hypothetical protein
VKPLRAAQALAAAIALVSLAGCGLPGFEPAPRPVLIEAVPLPVVTGDFSLGSTTQYDVMEALGPPHSVEEGEKGAEIWIYYPSRSETVYMVTFRSRKGEASFKYAPSNRLTLYLLFRNGKLVGGN